MASYLNSLLGDKEKILLVTHQHWFVLMSRILVELAFIILLTIGITVAMLSFQAKWAGFLYLLLLIPAFFIFMKILFWRNQQFIVTNHRVIHINGVINKNVIDSSLEKVNDVKLTQSYLGRIFNYGDIEILTASELGVNLLKRINEPIKYKTAMLNAKEATEHMVTMDRSGEGSVNGSDVPGMIVQLGELKAKGLITDAEYNQKKTELLSRMGSK
jgi:uncharacterized membrane protein YdbT with pleckstrin-like domain